MGWMKSSNHKSYRRCTSERDIFLKYVNEFIPYTLFMLRKERKKIVRIQVEVKQTGLKQLRSKCVQFRVFNSNIFFKLVLSSGFGCSSTYSNGNYHYNYRNKLHSKIKAIGNVFKKLRTDEKSCQKPLQVCHLWRKLDAVRIWYEYKTCR